MNRTLLTTALAATIVATAAPAPAPARVRVNTIDQVASLDGAGRVAQVTGPIGCTQAERATIRVTLSQRTTGAVAEGRWQGVCRRSTRRWTARRVVVQGSARFRTGRAQACALGVTRRRGRVTDARQWCQEVRLVRRERSAAGR